MWLFTPFGFFSIVKPEPKDKAPKGTLAVRARFKSDLKAMNEKYAGFGKIIELKGRDYPYRCYVHRAQVARIVATWIETMDYSNFKNEVYKNQGPSREELYHGVWQTMHDAEDRLKRAQYTKSAYATPITDVNHPGLTPPVKSTFNKKTAMGTFTKVICDACGTAYRPGERHGCIGKED